MSEPTLRFQLDCMPKDGHPRGQQMYKCGDCKKKQATDAEQTHFPKHIKWQAVQMCIGGDSLSAAARVVGASVTSVSRWLGEAAAAGCVALRG